MLVVIKNEREEMALIMSERTSVNVMKRLSHLVAADGISHLFQDAATRFLGVPANVRRDKAMRGMKQRAIILGRLCG